MSNNAVWDEKPLIDPTPRYIINYRFDQGNFNSRTRSDNKGADAMVKFLQSQPGVEFISVFEEVCIRRIERRNDE